MCENPTPILTPLIPKVWKLKWEKTLPEKLIIAAMEETLNSLKLKVEIETTNTVEKRSITALIDSRAMGEFIDRQYAKSCWLNLMKLTQPIPVYNVDGSPNEAGLIMEVVSLLLCYKNHLEWTTFCVTNLEKQKLLLGHSWLHKHNPEIDWAKGEIKMSRCATSKTLLKGGCSPLAIALWVSATHLVIVIDITGWYCAQSLSSRSWPNSASSMVTKEATSKASTG